MSLPVADSTPTIISIGGMPYVSWRESDGTNNELRVARVEPEFSGLTAAAHRHRRLSAGGREDVWAAVRHRVRVRQRLRHSDNGADARHQGRRAADRAGHRALGGHGVHLPAIRHRRVGAAQDRGHEQQLHDAARQRAGRDRSRRRDRSHRRPRRRDRSRRHRRSQRGTPVPPVHQEPTPSWPAGRRRSRARRSSSARSPWPARPGAQCASASPRAGAPGRPLRCGFAARSPPDAAPQPRRGRYQATVTITPSNGAPLDVVLPVSF